ncbi:MAG: hypothetical protein AABW79_04685 [Nanoarchaeota archaeon]
MTEDTKIETKGEKKKERKIEHEIMWIVGFAVVLVLIFLGTQQIVKWNTQFDYEGLHFTKTKIGKIPLYHYYYNFVDSQENTIRYNMYLRTDPRKNDIPIDRPVLMTTKLAYVALDLTSDLEGCSDSNLAVGDFALFLQQNQFAVKSGITNESLADELGKDYVTCELKDTVEVFEITRGEETRIESEGLCTKIIVGPDCEILNAIEKLKVSIVSDARSRAQGLIG